MPRWTRFRPSLPRRRRGWVQPANAITRALEREMAGGPPPVRLAREPAPVPAPVLPAEAREPATDRPSSAA